MTISLPPNTVAIYEAYLAWGRSGGTRTSIIHTSLCVYVGVYVCMCVFESERPCVCVTKQHLLDQVVIFIFQPPFIWTKKKKRSGLNPLNLNTKIRDSNWNQCMNTIYTYIQYCGAGWQHCENDNTLFFMAKGELWSSQMLCLGNCVAIWDCQRSME